VNLCHSFVFYMRYFWNESFIVWLWTKNFNIIPIKTMTVFVPSNMFRDYRISMNSFLLPRCNCFWYVLNIEKYKEFFWIIVSDFTDKSFFIFFCIFLLYLSRFQSKSIADAAYESLWYNLPLNQRKIIMFIIMRSQKQLTLTAGRFTNLSLETFTSVSFRNNIFYDLIKCFNI